MEETKTLETPEIFKTPNVAEAFAELDTLNEDVKPEVKEEIHSAMEEAKEEIKEEVKEEIIESIPAEVEMGERKAEEQAPSGKIGKAAEKSKIADDAVKAAKAKYQEVAAVAGAVQERIDNATGDLSEALKEIQKAERKRLKAWKSEARKRAADYLVNLKNADSDSTRADLKKQKKDHIHAWRRSLRDLDKRERKSQKEAFKAFKRRLHRSRRMIFWLVIIAILAAAVLAYLYIPAVHTLGNQWLLKLSEIPHQYLPGIFQ